MATLSDTWSLRAVYAFLGYPGSKTLPRGFGGTFTYAGLQVTVEPTNAKRNRLYRVYVTCTCGKEVAFCKFPQHASSKRHAGDTFTCLTREAIQIDQEHLASIRGRWSDDEIRARPYWAHLVYLLDSPNAHLPCGTCGKLACTIPNGGCAPVPPHGNIMGMAVVDDLSPYQ